jgi:hypothetical protein
MALLGFKNKFSPVTSPVLQGALEGVLTLMLQAPNTAPLSSSSSRGGRESERRGGSRVKKWTAVPGITAALGLYGLSGVNHEHHQRVVQSIAQWLAVNLSMARMQADPLTSPSPSSSGFSFAPSSSLQLRPHEIALACYGLRRFSSDSPEVRLLLSYLTQCIHNNVECLSHHHVIDYSRVMIEVSMLLYGMKRMQGEIREVQLLADAMTAWLEVLLTQHNKQWEMGVSQERTPFLSLDSLWLGEDAAAAALLAREGVRFGGGPEKGQEERGGKQPTLLDNQAICMCVSGLKYLSCEQHEVRRLVHGVTGLMQAAREARETRAEAQSCMSQPLQLWEVAKVMGGEQ